MTATEGPAIRRRPDGSPDIDHHAREALRARSAAMRQAMARVFRALVRALQPSRRTAAR